MPIDCSGCYGPCCIAVNCPSLVDGKCSIYESRPDICRTETMFARHYSRYMTREQYDDFTASACDSLRLIYRGNGKD